MSIMPGITNTKEPLIAEELNGDYFEIAGGQVRLKHGTTIVSAQGRSTNIGGVATFVDFPLLNIPEFAGAVVGGKFVVPESGLWSIDFSIVLAEGGVFSQNGNGSQSVNLFVDLIFPSGQVFTVESGHRAIPTGTAYDKWIVYGNTYTTTWMPAGTIYGLRIRPSDSLLKTLQQYPALTNIRITKLL
jgi:hypothetical protein